MSPSIPRLRTPPVEVGAPALSEPVRDAFVRRSTQAISRIAAQADLKTLADALAAATDIGALARVLGDAAAVGASVVELEPLAPLIARNAEHRLDTLAAAGGTLSSAEVATLLGISRQAVEKRRRAHALLAMRKRGDWRYPRCQFDETRGEVVSGLTTLLRGLAHSGPWATLEFLSTPDDTLRGETPLQVLRREGVTAALERLVRIEQSDGFG